MKQSTTTSIKLCWFGFCAAMTTTKDAALVWKPAAGCAVRINSPQLTLTHANDQAKLSLNVANVAPELVSDQYQNAH
jgi:hypothetical protein